MKLTHLFTGARADKVAILAQRREQGRETWIEKMKKNNRNEYTMPNKLK